MARKEDNPQTRKAFNARLEALAEELQRIARDVYLAPADDSDRVSPEGLRKLRPILDRIEIAIYEARKVN